MCPCVHARMISHTYACHTYLALYISYSRFSIHILQCTILYCVYLTVYTYCSTQFYVDMPYPGPSSATPLQADGSPHTRSCRACTHTHTHTHTHITCRVDRSSIAVMSCLHRQKKRARERAREGKQERERERERESESESK